MNGEHGPILAGHDPVAHPIGGKPDGMFNLQAVGPVKEGQYYITPTGRRGDWILTHSGKRAYPFDLRPEEIDLSDIAAALSKLNRWTGHTKASWSVAAHAIAVAEIVERIAPDLALAALHHDSAEAYLGNIAQPVKRSLRTEWGTTIGDEESIALRRIFEALGIDWPSADGWAVIRTADRAMLRAERERLMPPEPWMPPGSIPDNVEVYDGRAPSTLVPEFMAMHGRLAALRETA